MLASLFLCLASAAAFGGTGTLTASTNVDTFCTVAAGALSFGSYDPIVGNTATNLNATTPITITCVKGSSPTIGLSLGNYASGSTRRMRHATTLTQFLTYELYQPPNTTSGATCTFPGTTVWGSTGINLFSPGAAANKNSRVFNVCGTVPAAQNVEVGVYSDTVTVTVNF